MANQMSVQLHSQIKVTSTQVINFIGFHPNCTVMDIANNFTVSYAKVMPKLKKLIETGVVERKKKVGDKNSPFGHCLVTPISGSIEGQLLPQLDGLPVLGLGQNQSDQAVEKLTQDAITVSLDGLLSRIGSYAEEVATHAAVEFKKRFFDRFTSEIADLVLPAPEHALAARVKKLRICVVGSQSINASALQDAFKNELILDCIGADEIRKIQKSTRNAYATILMVDHVSHKAKQTIEASGVKPVFVNGGLSSLKDKLEEIYAVS